MTNVVGVVTMQGAKEAFNAFLRFRYFPTGVFWFRLPLNDLDAKQQLLAFSFFGLWELALPVKVSRAVEITCSTPIQNRLESWVR